MTSQTPANEQDLERLMASLGRDRYWARVETARKSDRITDLPAGRYLMAEATASLEKALASTMKKAAKQAGVGYYAYRYMKIIRRPAVLALFAVRAAIDSSGRQNSLVQEAHTLGSSLEEEARYMAIRDREPRVWRDLRHRLQRMRSKSQRRKIIRDVVAKLAMEFEPWPRKDKIRLGLVLLELVKNVTGLIEFHLVERPDNAAGNRFGRSKRYVVTATQETMEWIERSNEAHASLYPFYLPTLEPPVDWSNPWDGGYHTNIVARRPLVKVHDRRLVDQAAAGGDMGPVYRAVNTLQRTKWSVNKRVFDVAMDLWRAGTAVADLPERVDDPPVPRPDWATVPPESLDAVKRAFKRAAAERYRRIVASRSHRIMVSKILFMARTLVDAPEFYFPHQADFRGRVYPVPFFLQPQGPSLARGLLQFARGKPIRDKEQAEWFCVHGANCFGFDKVAFPRRIEWVKSHHDRIVACAARPLDDRWWAGADKPWEFLAWCLEYREWCERPAEFESRVPVGMDGSNNGLQIFSLLMRDRECAAMTNVLPSDSPRDIYQEVADAATAALIASTDPLAAKWVEFCGGRIPRAATKRAVMTFPYGSTFHACIHYTRDWYEAECVDRGISPKDGTAPFERGYGACVFLARTVWGAIGAKVGAAQRCMAWLRSVAQLLAENGKFVRWTSPSGFTVVQRYTTWQTRLIRTAVGDSIRKCRYRHDLDGVARKRQLNGISPNFVHSLDSAALVAAVNLARARRVSSVTVVHDSYGVLAADAPVMARSLREVYADMFSRPVLDGFRSQVARDLPRGVEAPELPELGDLDAVEVLKSRYFFA